MNEHVEQAIRFIRYALMLSKDIDPAVDKTTYKNDKFEMGWNGKRFYFDYQNLHVEWDDIEKDLDINLNISPRSAEVITLTCIKAVEEDV